MLREGKPIVSSRPPIEGRSARGLAQGMAQGMAPGGAHGDREPATKRAGGLAALGRKVRALLAPARPH